MIGEDVDWGQIMLDYASGTAAQSEKAALKKRPAYMAANAARVIGVVLVLFGLLTLIPLAMMLNSGALVTSLLLLSVVTLMYAGPGIALLVMSGGVKRGARGRTIATMVLGILIAAFILLASVGQLFALLQAPSRVDASMLVIAALFLVFGLVAALLVVYCIQSLRFSEQQVERGFEPLYAAPAVAQPATSANDAEPAALNRS